MWTMPRASSLIGRTHNKPVTLTSFERSRRPEGTRPTPEHWLALRSNDGC
jgi:hypothetical protein